MKLVCFLLYVVFICSTFINSQRNAEEEAICQPFLTSSKTSPLIENLARNLTVDEEGEKQRNLIY
jgi:hypothetical protein